jgi:hypothetical protein
MVMIHVDGRAKIPPEPLLLLVLALATIACTHSTMESKVCGLQSVEQKKMREIWKGQKLEIKETESIHVTAGAFL